MAARVFGAIVRTKRSPVSFRFKRCDKALPLPFLLLRADSATVATRRKVSGYSGVDDGSVTRARNKVPNSAGVGMGVGDTQTPGVMAPGWAASALSGLGVNTEIVGNGINNGVDYTDVRIYGTTTGALSNANIIISPFSGPLQNWPKAAIGQTWYASLCAAVLPGGTMSSATVGIRITEYTGASATNNGSTAITPPVRSTISEADRVEVSRTLNSAGIDGVRCHFYVSAASGVTVDFTVRIGGWHLNSASVAGAPYVRTTPTANCTVSEMCAANAPRFDYDKDTLQCRGLRVGPSMTDFFPNSLFAGTVGAKPTGFGTRGVSSGAALIGGAVTIDGLACNYVSLRKVASGVEGMQVTLSGYSQTGTGTYMVRCYVRRVSGVTEGNVRLDLGTSASPQYITIASAAQVAAQPVGAWILYEVPFNITVASTVISLISDTAAIGAGCDIALPQLNANLDNSYPVASTTTAQSVKASEYLRCDDLTKINFNAVGFSVRMKFDYEGRHSTSSNGSLIDYDDGISNSQNYFRLGFPINSGNLYFTSVVDGVQNTDSPYVTSTPLASAGQTGVVVVISITPDLAFASVNGNTPTVWPFSTPIKPAQFARMGLGLVATGSGASSGRLRALLDELDFWNYPLTQAEVQEKAV